MPANTETRKEEKKESVSKVVKAMRSARNASEGLYESWVDLFDCEKKKLSETDKEALYQSVKEFYESELELNRALNYIFMRNGMDTARLKPLRERFRNEV